MLKRLFQSKKHQPQARWGHSCVSVGTKAIVWGGMQATMPEIHQSPIKTRLTSVIEVFDLQTAKWSQERTVGNPPLGIRGQACTTIGSEIYFFGGFCGHDWCRHNTVYCLDSLTNIWREIVPSNVGKRPMKKSRCGMFHFRNQDGEDYLCVIGGTGLLCSANQTDVTYLPWRENPDWGWTDEHHILDLKNNKWIVPSMTGDVAPPCAGFTLTKISDNSAIFYGGYQPTSGKCLTDVYIVTVIDLDRVHWKKITVIPEPGRPNDRSLPVGRQDHTVVCLSSTLTGHNRTILLIMGGRDHGGNTLNDSWLLDIEKNMWTQVFLLESVAQRHFHSATSICLSPHTILVVLFGGVREWLWGKPARQQPALTATVILEATATPDGDWRLRVLMGETDTCPVEDYKNIVQQVMTIKENEEREEEETVDNSTLAATGGNNAIGSQDELDTSGDPLRPTSPTSRSSQVSLSTPNGIVIYDIPTSTNNILQCTTPTQDSPRTSNNTLPTIEEEESEMITKGSKVDVIDSSNSAINTIKDLQRQLIVAQGRANDIEKVLHKAVMSAEDRAVKAEEKSRVTEGRLIVLEGQVKTLEDLLKKLESESMESKNELTQYSEQTIELEKQLLDSENRAITSEIALNEVEVQLAEYEMKLRIAEEQEIKNIKEIELLGEQICQIKEDMMMKATRETPPNIQQETTPLSSLNMTLSLKSQDGKKFTQLEITSCQISQEIITLETELNKGTKFSEIDITNIATDLARALAYLHTHNLRATFNIVLEPSHIILIKKECYHGQFLVPLTSEVSPKENNFQDDLYKFGILLIAIATGTMPEVTDINTDAIQCPKLVNVIEKCLNNQDSTIDTLLEYVHTLNAL